MLTVRIQGQYVTARLTSWKTIWFDKETSGDIISWGRYQFNFVQVKGLLWFHLHLRSVGLTWVSPWVWNTLPICGSGQGYSAFGLSSAYRPHSGGAGAAGQGVSSAYGLRHPSSLGWSNRGVFCFFGICSASFVNHARQETSGMNVSGKLFPMLESSTQWKKLF